MDEITPLRKSEVPMDVGGPVDEARVTLAVYGETLDPDEVSRRLGCAPTKTFRKCETRRPSGREGRPMPHGAWFLTVEGKAPVGVDELTSLLLNRFPQDEQFWRDLGRDYRLQIRVAIHTGGWNRGFDLKPSTTKLVALTGGTLGFDLSFYGEDETLAPG
jgi:hypothetical protein